LFTISYFYTTQTNPYENETNFCLPVFSLLFTACHKPPDDYIFSKNRVGKLQGKISPEQARKILEKKFKISGLKKTEGIVSQKEMTVTDAKSGKPVMTLIFQSGKDTLQLYAVELISPEFISDRGIKRTDPFGKWQNAYKTGETERTLRHLVVFIKDLNATLEFNNEDLVDEARNRTLSKPDADWIKKDAVPRRVMIFTE
jgi:hypothetical protein